jgi:hypothetical protein
VNREPEAKGHVHVFRSGSVQCRAGMEIATLHDRCGPIPLMGRGLYQFGTEQT